MFKFINTTGLNKDLITLIHILLLLFSSIFANYYFGSIGVWPIDTFAFFDSANFINKGFMPIRDYWTSNGLLVDLIQSIFFKILGVSWKTYLLHSSALNFLFTLITYKFLIKEGLNSNYSFFYSFLISILAYPSIGSPFSDHHALIISLIGVYILIFAIKSNKNIFWVSLPIIFFLAFLCKQTPSGFFIILVFLIICLNAFQSKNYSMFFPLIFSSVITLIVMTLFLLVNKIGIKNFLVQYIYFPITIGSIRYENLLSTGFLYNIITELKFFLIAGIILIFQIKKDFNFKNKIKNLVESNFIFLLVTVVIVINQNLIKNQNIIFFILPLLFGLIHIRIDNTYKIKNVLISLIVILTIFVSTKYHYRFNVDRKFIELETLDKKDFTDSKIISKKLDGLKWITITNRSKIKNETDLLQESIKFLKENNDNSLIMTYYQFILSEIDHDFYPPNRWYTDDGVSYPLEKNRFHSFYNNFFKEKLTKYRIKKIFTLYPLDENDFNYILKKDCIKTTEINKILHQHELFNCFENEQ